MIPTKVRFTGLEIDPLQLLLPRCVRGVIPIDWVRHRFMVEADTKYPLARLSRWLTDHIEGRWAMYQVWRGHDLEIVLAFEHSFDGVSFVLADGKRAAFSV